MVYIKKAVARRRLAPFCIPPMVIIAVGAGTAAAALFKPLVLVAAVVNYKVHHQLDAAFVQAFKQRIKICHGAKIFHNATVIAYIITIIIVGRTVNGVKPHNINAQAFYIIQFGYDAPQVANTVAVIIFKTAGVYLIHYCFFPPFALTGI